MIDTSSLAIEPIVSTLLQVGERVFEISREHIITNAWENNGDENVSYIGKRTTDTGNDAIIKQCDAQIAETFATGKKGYIEYTTVRNNVPFTIGIRILPVHPDKQYLFAVVEVLNKNTRTTPVIEDKWKLALDATGDGMWDLNLETGNIFFSEKWQKLFGYHFDEIKTGEEWGSKVHPDDLAKSKELISRYFKGETPIYSSEFRYRCRDGSYKWIQSRGVIIARKEDGSPLRFIGTHTDINERKLAEEKFSSLAQMLSKLINNLRDGILVTDEHRKIVFANQMFCDLYDLRERPDQLIGNEVSDSLHKRAQFYTDSEGFEKRTDDILRKKQIVLNEEWTMKNGKVLSRDFIPLNLGENNKGGIWKLRDITEQKNTEQRLRELRNFYEEILNNIAGDIVVFDAAQRYMFINPAAIKNAEVRKWMIGKTDEDYCKFRNKPLAIVEERTRIFNTARDEKRRVEWVETLETPEGKIEYHLRNNYPVFDKDGKHIMSIGYGLDITDRKVAEEGLRTSKETFASAFDYSGVGMALISKDGKWLDVNNVMCQMTGYSKEELLLLSPKDITYPADFNNDKDLLRKLLKKEISTYSIERRYISKLNKIVQALLTVSMVWDADGAPKFLIAQAVDITEKKALEQEIQKKNSELEATKINLINKIDQLEELSHIIAHNLRGPAGNIKMLSGALLAKNQGGKTAVENMLSDAFSTDEVLGLIQDSSVSLIDSLSTLMEITEIKLNKEIPYNDCDVAAIINDISSQLLSIIFEKKAVIHQHLEVKMISYPKAYLENILYNLISNALKYSQQDTPPEITVSTRMVDGKVQLIVKDNGLGIDMVKYGDKVFKLNEIFHHGYDSKGVGLYITKTQIESFGGSIALNSKINEGCEFIVTL